MTHENTVELIGTYGGDMTHALSAWTSTSRELTEKKLDRVKDLLKMLAENDHGSPFEKSSIHFLITCDIVTHYQLLKHRIGVSINGESARYKELKDDKLYVPQDWLQDEQEEYIKMMDACYVSYHAMIERLVARGVPRKRAKESARFYLPYGNQITMDVMFNFRSFDHFLKLRYSEHAQVEIRDLAKKMLQQLVETKQFDLTLQAFSYFKEDGTLRDPFE